MPSKKLEDYIKEIYDYDDYYLAGKPKSFISFFKYYPLGIDMVYKDIMKKRSVNLQNFKTQKTRKKREPNYIRKAREIEINEDIKESFVRFLITIANNNNNSNLAVYAKRLLNGNSNIKEIAALANYMKNSNELKKFAMKNETIQLILAKILIDIQNGTLDPNNI